MEQQQRRTLQQLLADQQSLLNKQNLGHQQTTTFLSSIITNTELLSILENGRRT